MRALSKDALAGSLVAALAGAGILYGFVAGNAAVTGSPAPTGPAPPYEHASFCPPAATTPKKGVTNSIATTSASEAPVEVGLSFARRGFTLPSGALAVTSVPSKERPSGVDVVGYGGAVQAASLFHYSSPVNGLVAAACPSTTSARSYMPSGTTALGTSEKLILYNPFPNDAAVRIGFFTPGGEEASANLSNVGVPAGSAQVIPIDNFAQPSDTLGIGVTSVRGRIAAWSSVLYRDHPGRQPGATVIPGTSTLRTTWFVPTASVGDKTTQTVTVLNPTPREADMSVSLIGAKGPIQAPKLVSKQVAPRSIQSFDLGDYLQGKQSNPGAVSLVVRSGNDVPVAVGGTTFYSGSGIQGADASSAVAAPASSVVVEPAATSGNPDRLVIVNPSSRKASVDVVLQRPKAPPEKTRKLQGLKVGPGMRRTIDLTGFTKGSTAAALVRSTVPVVAGRTAYSKGVGDLASILGIPVNERL